MTECCSVKSPNWPAVMTCPVTGRRSKQVDLVTLRSLVRRLPLGMPSTAYYFCDDPAREVVYFPANPQAPLFRRADLWVRVGVKEKDGFHAWHKLGRFVKKGEKGILII